MSEPKGMDDGGPAYPSGEMDAKSGSWITEPGHPGMSLLDYFSAKAMQVLLADYLTSHRGEDDWDVQTQCIAADAYAMASAMLSARKEPK